VKESFKDTYHTEHPVYKIIHADKLKKKLSKKGLMLNQNTTSENFSEGKYYEATSLSLIGKKSDEANNVKNMNNSANIEAEN
jgi:hypothetical protein